MTTGATGPAATATGTTAQPVQARAAGWYPDTDRIGCTWYWDGESWDSSFQTISGVPLPDASKATGPIAAVARAPRSGTISGFIVLLVAVAMTGVTMGVLFLTLVLPVIAMIYGHKCARATYRGDLAAACRFGKVAQMIRMMCYVGLPVVAFALFALAASLLSLLLGPI